MSFASASVARNRLLCQTGFVCKPLVGVGNAALEANQGAPAHALERGDVEELTPRSVGLAQVVGDLVGEAHDPGDQPGEFEDRYVLAAADIDVGVTRIMPHQEDARVSEIVNVQEFTARRARTPDLEALSLGALRLVRLADQSRQDVAGLQIEIVARPVEVGRHGRDEVTAMLPAIGLGELDPGDLSDGAPLIGRLEAHGEDGILANRLRRKLGIDARRAEEEQLLDPDAIARLDDIRLDHQVVVEKVCRVSGRASESASVASTKPILLPQS